MTAAASPEALRSNRWAFGPWCFVVGEVKLLPSPLEARGMNGTWPMDARHRLIILDLFGELVYQALTLQQPYASALASGSKTVENRSFRRTISEGGKWYGLHSGKTFYGGMFSAQKLLDGWRSDPEGLPSMWPEAPTRLLSLPRGVLLGIVRFDACVRHPDAVE